LFGKETYYEIYRVKTTRYNISDLFSIQNHRDLKARPHFDTPRPKALFSTKRSFNSAKIQLKFEKVIFYFDQYF